MVELSRERIEQILHEETAKKEELSSILRSIYTRYMRLYEKYFADLDALNDERISELRQYHEETRSLVRYYYMDIPHDICAEIEEFEQEFSDRLLGPEWHDSLASLFEAYKARSWGSKKSEEELKAEFAKQALASFYDAMDSVFREGFGTGSETAKNLVSGIAGLLFGKEEQ